MKKWIVRFGALYVFNLVVLLLIDLLVAGVNRSAGERSGQAVILTAAVIWVKPLIHRAFTGMAAKSRGTAHEAPGAARAMGVVFVVELVVWILVVMLLRASRCNNWFFGYLLPPLIFLIGWAIYAAMDDRPQSRPMRCTTGARRGRRAVERMPLRWHHRPPRRARRRPNCTTVSRRAATHARRASARADTWAPHRGPSCRSLGGRR